MKRLLLSTFRPDASGIEKMLTLPPGEADAPGNEIKKACRLEPPG